jgi:predicted pyridoxine 5'-phosphate oxidase superfamily flavin-nucleotide-binding protein
MAKRFSTIEPSHRDFIERQRLFFTASAASDGRVNVSPKGLDALRVIDDRTVAYLDLTGSGNETAAHLKADGRLTIMVCAFEGAPLILRLYGRGRVIGAVHPITGRC